MINYLIAFGIVAISPVGLPIISTCLAPFGLLYLAVQKFVIPMVTP